MVKIDMEEKFVDFEIKYQCNTCDELYETVGGANRCYHSHTLSQTVTRVVSDKDRGVEHLL